MTKFSLVKVKLRIVENFLANIQNIAQFQSIHFDYCVIIQNKSIYKNCNNISSELYSKTKKIIFILQIREYITH